MIWLISVCTAGLMILIVLWSSSGSGQTVRPFSGLYSILTCDVVVTQMFAINTNRRLATADNLGLTSIRVGMNNGLTSTNGQRVPPGMGVVIRGSDYLGSVWCISEGPGQVLASVSLSEVGQ